MVKVAYSYLYHVCMIKDISQYVEDPQKTSQVSRYIGNKTLLQILVSIVSQFVNFV